MLHQILEKFCGLFFFFYVFTWNVNHFGPQQTYLGKCKDILLQYYLLTCESFKVSDIKCTQLSKMILRQEMYVKVEVKVNTYILTCVY